MPVPGWTGWSGPVFKTMQITYNFFFHQFPLDHSLLCFRWLIELVSYSVVVKSKLHCSNHKFKSYHNYIIKKMVVFNMGSIFVNHIVSLWHHSILIRGKVSYMRSDRNPLVCKLVVNSFILDRIVSKRIQTH